MRDAVGKPSIISNVSRSQLPHRIFHAEEEKPSRSHCHRHLRRPGQRLYERQRTNRSRRNPSHLRRRPRSRSCSRCSRLGLVPAPSATTIGRSSGFPWQHRRSRARSSFRPPHQRSSPAKPPMLLSPVARRFASNEESRSSPLLRVASQWARASFSCHSSRGKGNSSVPASLLRFNSRICGVGVVP
jgi:hypothetical protein